MISEATSAPDRTGMARHSPFSVTTSANIGTEIATAAHKFARP